MAFDAFLTIGDIRGESQRRGHEREIEVLSYSFGVQSAGTAGGAGAGADRPDFTDLSVVAYQSTATIPLLLSVATGEHHPTAVLTLTKAVDGASLDFFRVALEDVVVTSLHEGGSGGEDRPTDAFTLTFGKVTWSYTQQDRDGSAGSTTTGSWDLAENSTS